MARNCDACTELQEKAPEFTQNGVTSNVCASLKNDTGLSPSNGNNDEKDLNNAADCLVGNMEDEIEAYDVCDWKDFMKKFIPNLWNTLKAMICAIAGLWTNIHSLDKKLKDLCALTEALIAPPLQACGIRNNGDGQRTGGTIATKNGRKVLVARPHSELSEPVWKAQNVGFRHATLEVTSCSTNTCRLHEWIVAEITGYKFNTGVNMKNGDLLWYVDKATALSWGLTESLWRAYTESSWTWNEFMSNRQYARIRLTVNPGGMGNNYIGLVYAGASYPDDTPDGQNLGSIQTEEARLHRYAC